MIALQSRHFRKRTPDLHNSARFNTIPTLRAIKMNPVLKKNFAVFPVLDWIATLAAHIPDKGEQLLRYHGYYSNVSQGKRKKQKPEEKTEIRPIDAPPIYWAPRVSAHTPYFTPFSSPVSLVAVNHSEPND